MKKLLLLMLIAFYANMANAQWQQTNGPFGGKINCVATSGINIFAGTYNGVFLSTDNGSTWSPASHGLQSWNPNSPPNLNITSIAISGTNIFAGAGGGVFLSTNNGGLWTRIDNNFTNAWVTSLAISGTNIFAGTEGGVFLSTDNGSNWSGVNTGLTNTWVISLAISGTNIFAGTFGGGLFSSPNNGGLWTLDTVGLTGSYIYSLGISGTQIFAGTDNGVFLSNNNGTNWTPINTGLTNLFISSLAISGTNIFAVSAYDSVFLSTNNGGLWTAIDTIPIPTNTRVNSLTINGTNIFAGTAAGVFLSTNNGTNWTSVNTGLTSPGLNCLASIGTTIYAATPVGSLFVSTNNGNTWSEKNSWGSISSFSVNGTSLCAGWGGQNGGVAVSTDSGNTWVGSNFQLTNQDVTSVAAYGIYVYAGTSNGMFLSGDNGNSWFPDNSGLTNTVIKTLATNGQYTFAGTSNGGLYYTNTGLQGWGIWTSNSIPPTNALAADAIRLCAGTNNGVYLKPHNSTNWTWGLPGIIVHSLAMNASNIFAGTDQGVFFSKNNGISWSAVNIGLTDLDVHSVVISDSNIFAGTKDAGIFIRSLSEIINFQTHITSHTNACDGICQGTATASVSAGVGPYGYSWSPSGGINSTATNLCAGTYTVIVTDSSNMSTVRDSIAITQPPALNLNVIISGENVICDGLCSNLVANVTGGTPGYSFHWTPDQGSTPYLTTCPSITTSDTVFVTDANGCGTTASDTITVNSLDNPYFGYNKYVYCQSETNPSPIIYGLPGGKFTSSPSGLLLDSITGIINLSSSLAINYSILYTTNGMCPNSFSQSLQVNSGVWPGDANNDSLVNNNDLLPIGLYYGQTGYPRASISNVWQADSAADWSITQSNGIDIKHTDCNGDGTIDANDTLAINLNFNSIHAIPVFNNNSSSARSLADLYFVTAGTSFSAGDWVDVQLWLGSSSTPIADLYGIAFNINYDATLVQQGTESITYPSSWLGTPGTDALKIAKVDALANTAYGGITRTNQTNANGYGKIAVFKFQVKTSLTSATTMLFSVSNYKANDATGTAQTFTSITDSILIYPLTTGINKSNNNSGVTISPNPFTSQTIIIFNEEQKNITIKIIDVLGKVIKKINFSGRQLTIEKEEMLEGIYLLEMHTEKGIVSKKLVIQK